jgi:Leucine-rich repeat (LRR) protein
LSPTLYQDKKLLEMMVQPPEMWPTPPRPSYGSVKWQERLNQEKEDAKAAAEAVAVAHENIGEQTTYFETVHWHDRALESVPDSLWGIPSYAKLKHLYLENNNVKELPIQLSNFEFLEVFSFSKNDIGALPGWIGKLSELKIISLAHNRVPEIPLEIGDLCKLDTLNLYSNKIATIPLTLAHCTAITSLNLAANPWQVCVQPSDLFPTLKS